MPASHFVGHARPDRYADMKPLLDAAIHDHRNNDTSVRIDPPAALRSRAFPTKANRSGSKQSSLEKAAQVFPS